MKLSEMNTKQLAKALCELTQPVANICGDAEVMSALAVVRDMQAGKNVGCIADVIAKVMPVLLDKHYGDATAILSALTGKSREEIDRQSGMQTVTDIMTCMDGDVLNFFTSSAPTAQTPSSVQCTPTEPHQTSPLSRAFWRRKRKAN